MGPSCHRCRKVIPYYTGMVSVERINGRGVVTESNYHPKCLPPQMFHEVTLAARRTINLGDELAGSLPACRVAPD